MRRAVAMLMEGPPWASLGIGSGLAVLGVLALLWGMGLGGVPDFSSAQNTAFGNAIEATLPLEAVEDAPPGVAKAIVEAANRYRGNPKKPAWPPLEIAPAKPTAPDPAAKAEDPPPAQWNNLCSLEGWGDHRAVVRKLVVEGYGGCLDHERFAARSPWIYRYGSGGGWALVLLSLFEALLILSLLGLVAVRRAYAWLYRNHSGVT